MKLFIFLFILISSFSSLLHISGEPQIILTLDLTPDHHSTYVTVPIQSNFFGLAIEWWSPTKWYTGPSSNLRQSFLNILPYMTTQSGIGPTLRIGGSTTDDSIYNDNGKIPQPDWYYFTVNITDDDYIAVNAVAQKLNLTAVIGISFRLATNLTYTMPEVDAIDRLMDWNHVVIEIGNEPELYVCTHEEYRPCGWSYDDYTKEFDNVSTAIFNKYPNLPKKILQGGAFAGGFIDHLADFAIPRADRFWSVSFHRYPCMQCSTNITVEEAFTDSYSLPGFIRDGYLSKINYIQSSTTPPLPVILGEGNICWCNEPFYNTLVMSLWTLDYALAAASVNITSYVLWIGWEDPRQFLSSPFQYFNLDKDEITILPTMYGLYAFCYATWNNARLINSNRNSDKNTTLVSTYTLIDDDNNVVLVAISKDVTSVTPTTVNITITLPSTNISPHQAKIVRLIGSNINSNKNISFAGLTWENTTNGIPIPVKDQYDQSYEYYKNNNQTYHIEVESVKYVDQIGRDLVYSVSVYPSTAVVMIISTALTKSEADQSWNERVTTILKYDSSGI